MELRAAVRLGISCLTILAVLLWAAAPSGMHAPKVQELLRGHAETVAAHGHSHGVAEDLLAALHGHDHDAVDHDHSPAILMTSAVAAPAPIGRDLWRAPTTANGPAATFRIERPPRV
jgi:hypothetical protein